MRPGVNTSTVPHLDEHDKARVDRRDWCAWLAGPALSPPLGSWYVHFFLSLLNPT